MPFPVHYTPTPETIRQECLRVQQRWSPRERYQRGRWWFERQRVCYGEPVLLPPELENLLDFDPPAGG